MFGGVDVESSLASVLSSVRFDHCDAGTAVGGAEIYAQWGFFDHVEWARVCLMRKVPKTRS